MTHKLLLADDSVTIQRVVELTFSGEDVQVVTVGDGEEAIARIPIEQPDVVLADIGMPKRSGYEVAAFVKGRPDLAHIPVLLLAGAFEPVDEGKAREVHSDGVLVKPFEPQQVISRVKDLIASSRPVPAAAPAAAPVHQEPTWPAAESIPFATEERRPEAQPAPAAAIPSEPALDDYFERLDEAFSQLGSTPPRPAPVPAHDEGEPADVPTVERVLASHVPEREHHAVADAGRPTAAVEEHPGPPRNLVADMFAALFAVEQGEGGGTPVPISPPARQVPGASDALVDEVTRRVLERLAPDAASDLVAQIVSEVAERLVREEIARIKTAAAARL